MGTPDFKILVYNTLEGKLLNVPLNIKYTDESDNQISRIVSPGYVEVIGSSNDFLPDPKNALAFTGYGSLVGGSVQRSVLLPNALKEQWKKVKKSDQDNLIIIVSSKQPLRFEASDLTFTYANVLPDTLRLTYEKFLAEGNALAVFGRLRDWKLVKAFTEEQFLKAPSNDPKKELVPSGLFQSGTTLEEVSRYILGLDKDYTESQAQNALTQLAYQWNAQEVGGKGAQAFNERVMDIAGKAYDVLTHALKQKASQNNTSNKK